MKKFTEKEISTFKNYIKEDILSYMDNEEVFKYCVNKIFKQCKTDIYELVNLEMMDFANFISEVETTYDTEYLLRVLVKRLKSDYGYSDGEIFTEVMRADISNRKELITILGLRDWATKEDIINEINNIL